MQSNVTLMVNYSNQEKMRFVGAEQTLGLLLASILLVIPDLLPAQPMSTQSEKVWKLLKMYASCWSDCQMNNTVKDLLSTLTGFKVKN